MRTLEKILIVRFSSLGDVVLASPLIRTLRRSYPQARIDFLVKSEYADAVRFNPNLTSIIELRTGAMGELRSLKASIRRERYDLLVDLHSSLRSRYLRFFSGARRLRVADKRVLKRFLLVKFKWNFYSRPVPVADRYLETVRAFCKNIESDGLEIFIPDDTRETVAAMLERYRLDKYDHVIGIAPMARHFTKRWIPERFVDLGLECAKRFNAKLLIIGGKEDHDSCSDIAQMINSRGGSSIAENLAGKVTLLEAAAVMDSCTALVTNDTGFMHIASARKRKICAIFGSTVQEFGFFPYLTESRVVEIKGLPCRPCSHIGLSKCPRGHFKCMNDIQVDDVMKALTQLVEA